MAKKKPLKTDINIHYLIPLVVKANKDKKETKLRETKIISTEGGMIRCQAVEDPELFEIHSFADDYFQWLIYTNYIIPLN